MSASLPGASRHRAVVQGASRPLSVMLVKLHQRHIHPVLFPQMDRNLALPACGLYVENACLRAKPGRFPALAPDDSAEVCQGLVLLGVGGRFEFGNYGFPVLARGLFGVESVKIVKTLRVTVQDDGETVRIFSSGAEQSRFPEFGRSDVAEET